MYKCFVYLGAKIDKKRKLWEGVVKKLETLTDSEIASAQVYYDLGLAYCKMKKWHDASKYLAKAVDKKFHKLSWRYRYAVALENSGNKRKSKEVIESIFLENGADDKKHFKSGLLLLGYSRPFEAEKSFRKAIQINEKNYKYHLALVIALNKQGKGKSWIAIEALEKAIKINPKAAELHYALGLNYENVKSYHLATYSYVKTILNKNNSGLLNEFITRVRNELEEKKSKLLIKKSENLFSEGLNANDKDPTIAEVYFRNAIEINGSNPEYYIQLAEALEKQGDSKLWQQLDALKSAIDLGFNTRSTLYKLGIASEKLKDYLQARQAYELALGEGLENAEIYYRLGFCLNMAGQENASVQAFEKAISFDRKLNSKRFGIGVFHNKHGRRLLAIDAFKKQSELNPFDGELLYKLGMSYDRFYKWNEAKKVYKRAIKLEPYIFEWQYRLGFVFERLHNYKEAAYWYEKAAKGREKHTPYWFYRLGFVLNSINDFKGACEAFIKTHNEIGVAPATLAPGDSLSIQFYKTGVNYEISGEFEKALNMLNNAINCREGDSECILYRMACIEYKRNNYKQASKYFISSRTLQAPHGVSDKNYRENESVRRFSDYNFYFCNKEIDKNRIMYESFQGSSLSCNPLAIFLELYSMQEFHEFKHFWVINDILSVPEYIRSLKNVYFVKHNSNLYLECLATSKLLINNSTFPPYFTKRQGQVYINTWHGTPLKTLGRDMSGRFLEHKNFTRNILQSDILLSPNAFTTSVLRNSHDIKGIYTGEVLESGYPRIDLTLTMSKDRRSSIINLLGLTKNKKVIFYAPTWRGTHGDISFDKEQLVNDLTRLAKTPNTLIVFRGHSLLESALGEIKIAGVTVLPKCVDTNEFLSFSDILITDYSSIFFDYYPTKRSVLFYAYDFDEYSRSRGMYLDLESLPGIVSYDIDALIKDVKICIKNNCKLKNADKLYSLGFNEYDDGNATKRVASSILSKIINSDKEMVKNVFVKEGSKSFLFYTGPFMRNGITTSFINLANTLISMGHTVSVVVDANAIAKHEDRLEQISKLNVNVNIIGRVGGIVFDIEERYIHGERNRDHYLINSDMERIWLRSWRKEYSRIFGNAYFDCIINFEGYTNFWSSLFSAQTGLNKNIYQHNDMYSEYTQKYPYLLGGFSNYKNYDRVISVSKETRDLNFENISKIVDVKSDNFVFSQNLLNLDTIFSMSKEDILPADKHLYDSKGTVFINIGRLSIEKDHAKLLKSFKIAHDCDPNVKLIILGEGALKSDLIKLTSELKISDSVHFLGHRLNPYPYLAKADCFVLSSNHEGQPMTLLEALTLGKDIIATSIAGNNSVLKLIGESGVENTVSGLSSALVKYINDGKRQKAFDFNFYQKIAIDSFINYTIHEKNDA